MIILLNWLRENWQNVVAISSLVLLAWFVLLRHPGQPFSGFEVRNRYSVIGLVIAAAILGFLYWYLSSVPEAKLREAGFAKGQSESWTITLRDKEFILTLAEKQALGKRLGNDYQQLDPVTIDYRVVNYNLPYGTSMSNFFRVTALYTGRAVKNNGMVVNDQSLLLTGYGSSRNIGEWLDNFIDALGSGANARNTVDALGDILGRRAAK